VNNKVIISIYCLFAGIICFVLYQVFNNTYINHDVALNYYYSECITEGQKPYIDFMDMNAPTIWYLFIPIVGLHNVTSIPADILIRLFVGILSVYSIAVSVYYWSYKKTNTEIFAFVLLLSCVFLLGIDLDFGQREHLTVLLTVPTFFLFSTANEKSNRSPLLSTSTIFLFIIGIAIKPLYVLFIIPLFIYRHKEKLHRNKYVLLGFLAGILFVSIPVVLHFNDYVKALRFAEENYLQYSVPYRLLLSKTILPFTFLALIAVTFLRLKKIMNRGGEIFFLSACIAFITLVVQQKGFTYHYYPLWSFTILSLVSSLTVIFQLNSYEFPRKIHVQEILLFVLIGTSINPLYVLMQRLGKDSDVGHNIAYSLSMSHNYAKGGSVLNLSTQVDPMAHTLLYENTHISTQFSCLWFLPVFYNTPESNTLTFHSPDSMTDNEHSIYRAFIDSICKRQPNLIIVNESQKKLFFKSGKFDFLKYFQQDTTFSDFFRNYSKVGFYVNTSFYAKTERE